MGFIEYTNITLKMILDSGLIEPGTYIYSSSQPAIRGTINGDGSISLPADKQDKVFQSPSGAARAVTKLSINGWTFWKVLIDNEYKDLSFLRKLYSDTSSAGTNS